MSVYQVTMEMMNQKCLGVVELFDVHFLCADRDKDLIMIRFDHDKTRL